MNDAMPIPMEDIARSYPLPPWIAHRGGGALAPENTLAGIRLAAHLGFQAVEFDVMLTADEVPILMHDETVDRTTNGRGRVARLEWEAIARLDAGAAFHPTWAGEPVPRLADALELCVALGLAANVEIKPASHAVRTGQVVAETVQRCWPAAGSLLFSSFSEEALAVAGEVAAHYPRALLVRRIPHDWASRVQALGCQALHAHAAGLSARQVAELRAAEVPVAAYTVNSAGQARRCFRLGVAALFTDRLDFDPQGLYS